MPRETSSARCKVDVRDWPGFVRSGRLQEYRPLSAPSGGPGPDKTSTPAGRTDTSSINEKANSPPKPNRLVNSERPVRAVKTTCSCACGCDDYVSWQGKKLLQERSICASTDPDQVQITVKNRETKTANTKAPEDRTFWLSKYPKVKLCDIAKISDTCSQDCGYVVPDVLKTQLVRCCHRDLNAGFRLGTICTQVHGKTETGHASYSESYRSASSSSQTDCQPIHVAMETSVYPTMHLALEAGRSGSSTTPSARLLAGNIASNGASKPGASDRDVEDTGTRGESITAGEQGIKRLRMGSSVRGDTLSSGTDLEPFCHSETAAAVIGGGKEVESPLSDSQSCADSGFGCGDASDTTAEGNGAESEEGGVSRVTSRPSSFTLDKNGEDHRGGDIGSPELFSCQRTSVYLKLLQVSCARTCMAWPFPKCCPVDATSVSADTHSVESSAAGCNDALVNQNGGPHTTANDQPTIIPTGAATDSTLAANRCISYHRKRRNGKDERQEFIGNGEHFGGDKNGEKNDSKSSSSLAKRVNESASRVTEAVEDGCRSLSKTRIPSALEDQTERGVNAVAGLPPTDFGNGVENHFSATVVEPAWTPSPAGLNQPDSAPAPSHTLFSCTAEDVSGILTTPSPPPLLFPPSKVKLLYLGSPTSPSSSPTRMSNITENPLSDDEATASSQPACSSSSPPHAESCHSCDSSLPLIREEPHHDPFTASPVLASGSANARPSLNSPIQQWLEKGRNMLILQPPLSPIASPANYLCPSDILQTQSHSDERDEKIGESENNSTYRSPQGDAGVLVSPLSFPAGAGDEEDGKDDEYHEEEESELDHVLSNRAESPHDGGVLAELHSSSSTDDDDDSADRKCDEARSSSSGNESSSPSLGDGEVATSEQESVELAKIDAAEGSVAELLDEVTAYEQDILLLDLIEDDPELFGVLPKEEGSLKPEQTSADETPDTSSRAEAQTPVARARGTSGALVNRACSTNATPDPFILENIKEENKNSSTRFQCRNTTSQLGSNSWASAPKESGIRNLYCWQYFSEVTSCSLKVCRFKHVPVDGDEKFCVETVARLSNSQNPACLQKAGIVFTAYYQNNPMGPYFSKPLLMSLLHGQLRLGLVLDIISVINISLAHWMLPHHEFLLALFDFVRVKGLCLFLPELMQLMSKIEDAGLELKDGVDYGRASSEIHQTAQFKSPILVSGNHKLSPMHCAESLIHAFVELCGKQEDWRWMGLVFRSVCQASQDPTKLEGMSGHIAVALLADAKDNLAPPFATFANMAIQDEADGSLIKHFVGRIGVSLMFRYCKTQHWAKGRKVVELLSALKVNYSMLKGLFGNENRASRCCLVTMATELFLQSGSVEGALATLRDNEWFLTSNLWPCTPSDMSDRSRLLMQLIQKTSHRDTLEVLSNLPGLKEPHVAVDSQFSSLFNRHLHLFMERQALPVASDTVDFMFSRALPVYLPLLQVLLDKLGKQKMWMRARKIFNHALSVGHYPGISGPPGSLALTVPCDLGETEFALSFEMCITANAAAILNPREMAPFINITLKRTSDCENTYLSAGSRLLSAAVIPNPKLLIRFTAVSNAQEQIFTLDPTSARGWLRHNCLWARDVWRHIT